MTVRRPITTSLVPGTTRRHRRRNSQAIGQNSSPRVRQETHAKAGPGLFGCPSAWQGWNRFCVVICSVHSPTECQLSRCGDIKQLLTIHCARDGSTKGISNMLRAFIAILLFAAASSGPVICILSTRSDPTRNCSTRPLTKPAGTSSPCITRLMAGGCPSARWTSRRWHKPRLQPRLGSWSRATPTHT